VKKALIHALMLSTVLLTSSAFAQGFVEAPRVVAALEQGLAAERGVGLRQNYGLAIQLYCDAATMGSSEGFFRIGRMLSQGSPRLRNPSLANAYLALAARLGHREASLLHDPSVPNGRIDEICTNIDQQAGGVVFDLEGYIAGLSAPKRKLAPHYDVDERMALGIALAESNFDANAVSPKNAQGVMQLIPETQERFGVKKPFDPEQNIKGGLAYLKWLQNRFGGDLMLVAAAYNSGEGTVERYGDVPPFPETQQYVRRVLEFSGLDRRSRLLPATK
jgi:Transglycosylase SLT domain